MTRDGNTAGRPLTSSAPLPSRPEAFVSTQSRVTPSSLAFHSSRIVVDVGVLVVMAAMSRPFVTAAGGNRSSIDLDALPVLLLVAPIFLVTLIPDHTRPLPRVLGWLTLVLGLAAFPYAIVKYLDSSVLAGTLDGAVGLGAWLAVIGTLVTVTGIAIGLTRSFMGLQTGGAPGRHRSIRHRPVPASTAAAPAPPAAETATPAPERTPAGDSPRAEPPVPAKPAPSRPLADQNPFVSPLFDSLEIPALVDAEKQGLPTFEGEDASERSADDEGN